MAFSNIRSSIARETTTQKISLLRSQRQLLENQVGDLFSRDGAAGLELLQRKIAAVRGLRVVCAEDAITIAEDASKFLEHERLSDVRISETALATWHNRLTKQIELLTHRLDYAIIFCDILQQWLDTDGKEAQKDATTASSKPVEDANMNRLPDLPIEPFNPKEYLESNNLSEKAMRSLQKISKLAEDLGKRMLKEPLSPKHVRDAMKSLAMDISRFSPGIRRQLQEESEKDMAVQELATALSETWRSIDTAWSWPAEGVRQTLQTHINGKQRMFLELDVVQAIFLQIIGQRWSTFFKGRLQALRRSDSAWNASMELEVPDPATTGLVSIQSHIIELADKYSRCRSGEGGLVGRRDTRFLNILDLDAFGNYDGTAEKAQVGKVLDSMWDSSIQAVKPAQSYDHVYRSITTDIALAQCLDPNVSMTVLRGDLENFGASVPHDTALAVMEFFGMPKPWLKWFAVYVQVPLVVNQADGKATVQQQMRGLPFGQSISTLANELLLVLLDMVIVAKTGLWMNRNHDDYWLWSVDYTNLRVDQAWDLMNDFTRRTGLAWNMTKTGSTVIGPEHGTVGQARSLPPNKVDWGILTLQHTGRWEVEEAALSKVASKARSEWNKSKSFLGKINVLNKYQSFLVRNCGPALKITGVEQIKMMQSVLNRFLVAFFDGSAGATKLHDELRKTFQECLPHHANDNLMDGLFSWPTELGGLHLHAHAIHTMLWLHEFADTDHDFESIVLEDTRKVYQQYKEKWTSDSVKRKISQLAAAFRNGSDESPEALWASEHVADPPAFVDEKAFITFFALYDMTWHDAYNGLSEDVKLSATAYKSMAVSLYGNSLTDMYGMRDDLALIPQDLIPQYACDDLRNTTKQLYTQD